MYKFEGNMHISDIRTWGDCALCVGFIGVNACRRG